MVFCTYCGQSFTRDEHLERHILTHTNVKPFKCFTCHMSFARRDLLQRHYTVHGRDQNQEPIPAANGIIPKSAGRTPIACSNCAKTKTKCDKKFPCSRCAGRNLKCTLRPTRRASRNVSRAGASADGVAIVPHPVVASSADHGVPQLAPKTSPGQPVGPVLKPASPAHLASAPILDTPSTLPVDHRPLSQHREGPSSGSSPPSTTSFYSPLQSMGTTFVPPAHLSEYEELPSIPKESPAAGSSPQFMLDWSQLQMPIGHDAMHQPFVMDPDIFDPQPLPLAGTDSNGMLTIMASLADRVPPLMTPIETPKIDRTFPELESSGVRWPFPLQRYPSVPSMTPASDSCSGELAATMTAVDAWSAFRCGPIIPSSSCPKTARQNLEQLEETLRDHQGWSTWSPNWDQTNLTASDHLTVMQLHDSTRDKLLAITQGFLHKALKTHQDHSSFPSRRNNRGSSGSGGGSNFVLLPPARVLEYFLRSYANCLERYYPLTSRGTLDANELMHCYNDRAASLLILMMITLGATNMPSAEARMLTGGLTEACRISLQDLVERNVVTSADPMVLHAALLFTTQAAWSGDKWQMDAAAGQRGVYLAMLRQSGFLEARPGAATTPHRAFPRANADHLWNEWTQNEARSRLIYSWAMVDQELALFLDSAPLLSIGDFTTPMPDADRLWHANSAAQWSAIFEHVHEFSAGYSSLGSGARPGSLKDLFRHLLDDEMVSMGIEVTPLHLRLLLHPLQALVSHAGHVLGYFSDSPPPSARARVQEAQTLLRRWFDLAERYLKANPMCAMMRATLVLFHLVSLNTVTSFAEIERLARREDWDGSYSQLAWRHKRCIADVERAVFHCGQVLRLVPSMAPSLRPPWWAGAIYRVALVLWAESLVHKEPAGAVGPDARGDGGTSGTSSGGSGTSVFPVVPGPSFAIDVLAPDHPLIVRYLTKREGVPCVTKRDGSQMPLDRAFAVLQHCVQVIDDGATTKFSDGIRSKLDKLARR